MSVKSALSTAAVLLAGAAFLTACQPDSSTSASTPAPSRQAGTSSAPATTAAPVSPSTPAATPSRGAANSGGGKSASSGSGSGSGDTYVIGGTPTPGDTYVVGGTHPTSDSYAWKHPCAGKQLTVRVVGRPSAPTQRVIEVRNNGKDSCGLSYYPHVVLRSPKPAPDFPAITPLVPDGLGGPPATPLHAGRTLYAVIDLDPSGATKGSASGNNVITVLADGDHMSPRDTLTFPLGPDARILTPKLGLYRSTLTDAVTSMRSANIHP